MSKVDDDNGFFFEVSPYDSPHLEGYRSGYKKLVEYASDLLVPMAQGVVKKMEATYPSRSDLQRISADVEYMVEISDYLLGLNARWEAHNTRVAEMQELAGQDGEQDETD